MAKQFTDLTALAGADAADEDVICIVDVDADSSHKMTLEELIIAIFLLKDAATTVPITIKTIDYTILAGDSLDTFTSEGTTEEIEFTLPTAVAGYQYSFVVQDNDGIKVIASASDTIRIGNLVTVAAGYISSNVIGSVITLTAVNATEWYATSYLGDWDVETS